MSTDRELLEFAARAAGIALEPLSPRFTYSEARGFERSNMDGSAVVWRWSPLTDDGDAFRLAVKLRMRVDAGYCGCADAYGHMVQATEAVGDDLGAATRRAIVRAAAAIGEGK